MKRLIFDKRGEKVASDELKVESGKWKTESGLLGLEKLREYMVRYFKVLGRIIILWKKNLSGILMWG